MRDSGILSVATSARSLAVTADDKSFLLLTAVPCLAAIGVGCFAVSVDLHNDEVQAAVLVLLVGGFLIGAIWPAGAWRWALILGVSILVGDNAAPRLGMSAGPVEPMNWGTVIAMVPAFIGTYLGVGVRALISPSVSRP